MADELCSEAIATIFSRIFNSSLTVTKSSALVLLLVVASGFAEAVDHQSDPKPCKLSETLVAGLNGDLSRDVHAVNLYIATIGHILKEEKFEELDCLADHARVNKERFPGGAWKLHTLYVSLYSPVQYPVTHGTAEEWNTQLQRLQKWVTARPKSITARVALARAYLDYAYDARGVGMGDTVSKSGWKLFGERSAEAKRILQEASNLSSKCSEWYVRSEERR